ncbi:uncharacterized protein BO95DRAFT_486221 [Aspergillus brunneoviolaceus CBS 621.78]|uniref:Uncharacterized protein n=1 Tax=Aspergillus brunneoviolaceus CBS 621.78 TaxID=1450534 RepID=A0ACD1FTW4_9EURO|nr:hypothetical protein BO95DRAFT_486221 [Aspergillus brunneoviolaceus CBS 621.78]RAH40417.1 hypothetical protein BO95DRAFT_486221 [Aspergillus brunneoviolaceus CBS 621.78]
MRRCIPTGDRFIGYGYGYGYGYAYAYAYAYNCVVDLGNSYLSQQEKTIDNLTQYRTLFCTQSTIFMWSGYRTVQPSNQRNRTPCSVTPSQLQSSRGHKYMIDMPTP